MRTNAEIDIRDTYILPYEGKYYMYGTTGRDAFSGSSKGFQCYVGTDLEHWEGPYSIFPNDGSSWATCNYWAPEVYAVNGSFYLFGSWSVPDTEQILCVLKAEHPLGPFHILNDRLGTGNDPTLYEAGGKFYLIHNDGFRVMLATELSTDLSHMAAPSVELFSREDENVTWSVGGPTEGAETFVTPTGRLLVLWSSFCQGHSKKFAEMGFVDMDYGTAIAYSPSGDVHGPYIHEDEMITPPNMGHCNLFRALDGQLMLATHFPDDNENEFGCSNPIFFPIEYRPELDSLRIDPKAFRGLGGP